MPCYKINNIITYIYYIIDLLRIKISDKLLKIKIIIKYKPLRTLLKKYMTKSLKGTNQVHHVTDRHKSCSDSNIFCFTLRTLLSTF